MFKREGSIPAMPEAKNVTTTVSNLFDVARARFARALHQAASIAGAPRGFCGFKPQQLVVGGALQYTSIGSPIEAGGPVSGSFALTIDEGRARREGVTWTGDHGWSDRIVTIIAEKASPALLDAGAAAEAAVGAPPATPGAAESLLYYPRSALKPPAAARAGSLTSAPRAEDASTTAAAAKAAATDAASSGPKPGPSGGTAAASGAEKLDFEVDFGEAGDHAEGKKGEEGGGGGGGFTPYIRRSSPQRDATKPGPFDHKLQSRIRDQRKAAEKLRQHATYLGTVLPLTYEKLFREEASKAGPRRGRLVRPARPRRPQHLIA